MRAAVAAALLIAAVTAAERSAPRTALAMPLNPRGFTAAGDACGAPEYAGRIGEPYDETVRAVLPANVRIIRHDMANTLEFTPSRTNVLLDERGQIAAIGCY
jgi:hypothetical protein